MGQDWKLERLPRCFYPLLGETEALVAGLEDGENPKMLILAMPGKDSGAYHWFRKLRLFSVSHLQLLKSEI